jgi:hypothetical protein
MEQLASLSTKGAQKLVFRLKRPPVSYKAKGVYPDL